jgi:lipopolysaccharide transport system ATP-binding protein
MSDIAIRIEGLSKLYHLSALEGYNSLRDTLSNTARSTLAFFRSPTDFAKKRRIAAEEHVWALKDISFEVKQGEVLGIIGHNGAGKTTLLRILSRITMPTYGYADIRGRIGSLLEVGTGFHPELTGRENIYLNGAILGMKRAEIRKNFDGIVGFSGVEKFIDTPVKHYSSGMHVRLAFSVAAHLEPEILLIDEVLAVGDVEFQKRCLGKMDEISKGGRTILFVSHNMGAVGMMCSRVACLEKGKVADIGKPDEMITQYLNAAALGFSQSGVGSKDLHIEKVVLKDGQGNPKSNFHPGDDICIEIHYHAEHPLKKPYFWLGISGPYGLILGGNMMFDGHRPDVLEGKGVLACTFRQVPLLPQFYSITLGAREQDGTTRLFKPAEVASFSVQGTAADIGLEQDNADSLMWKSAPVFSPYEWRFPDGKVFSVTPKWFKRRT